MGGGEGRGGRGRKREPMAAAGHVVARTGRCPGTGSTVVLKNVKIALSFPKISLS